jgi:hypothetical protein
MTKVFTEMSMESMKEAAPSIFTEKASSKVSERYSFIPTSRLVDDLGVLGWKPYDAKEVKIKKNKENRQGYQKHFIRFRNPDIFISDENGIEAFPEILVTNQHDGMGSFSVHCGLFRLVCSNGLVVADKSFGKRSIRHYGYSFEEVRKVVEDFITILPGLVDKINTFKRTELTENQMAEFALKAALIRWNQKESPIDHLLLLNAKRNEDMPNNMWCVLNRIQENLIQGGYSNFKNRKVREIKNFSMDLRVNRELFELAEGFIAN